MQDANEGEANECVSDRNDELFYPVQKGESDCRAKRAGELFEKEREGGIRAEVVGKPSEGSRSWEPTNGAEHTGSAVWCLEAKNARPGPEALLLLLVEGGAELIFCQDNGTEAANRRCLGLRGQYARTGSP
jgi:hypothetical protein